LENALGLGISGGLGVTWRFKEGGNGKVSSISKDALDVMVSIELKEEIDGVQIEAFRNPRELFREERGVDMKPRKDPMELFRISVDFVSCGAKCATDVGSTSISSTACSSKSSLSSEETLEGSRASSYRQSRPAKKSKSCKHVSSETASLKYSGSIMVTIDFRALNLLLLRFKKFVRSLHESRPGLGLFGRKVWN
jgi:hypothetical protein